MFVELEVFLNEMLSLSARVSRSSWKICRSYMNIVQRLQFTSDRSYCKVFLRFDDSDGNKISVNARIE